MPRLDTMHRFWEIRQGAGCLLCFERTHPRVVEESTHPPKNRSQNRANWQKQKICIVMSWMASSNFMVFQLQWMVPGGSWRFVGTPQGWATVTSEVKRICWRCHAGTNWLGCCSNKGFLADLSLPTTGLGARQEVSIISTLNTRRHWNWLSRIDLSEFATWGSLQRARYYSGPSVLIERIWFLSIQRPKKTPRIWPHAATVWYFMSWFEYMYIYTYT